MELRIRVIRLRHLMHMERATLGRGYDEIHVDLQQQYSRRANTNTVYWALWQSVDPRKLDVPSRRHWLPEWQVF